MLQEALVTTMLLVLYSTYIYVLPIMTASEHASIDWGIVWYLDQWIVWQRWPAQPLGYLSVIIMAFKVAVDSVVYWEGQGWLQKQSMVVLC